MVIFLWMGYKTGVESLAKVVNCSRIRLTLDSLLAGGSVDPLAVSTVICCSLSRVHTNYEPQKMKS